jgi:hypothetical protein
VHDLGVALLAAGLGSLATWHLGYRSGKRDELERIGRHLARLRREQER